MPAITLTKPEELPPPNIIAVIADAARDPAVDPAKLRSLLELHRELERDVDRRLFYAAMSRVQGAISQVATDAANPQTASRYASYAALDAALRPHYTAEGFSVSYDAEPMENGLLVTCIVNRGAWETRHRAPIPMTTHGAKGGQVMTVTHAAGSALSYGKRYSLGLAFSVAVARDDDGNKAGTKTVTPSQLEEMMKIVDGRSIDVSIFCPWASERLGYQIDDLSMVLRSDKPRVVSWLMRSKRESQ